MSVSRAFSLTILTLVATTWAAGMVVFGLWLLGRGSDLVPGRVRVIWGLLWIAWGQYVFIVVVANRLFPEVGRRALIWYAIELPTIGVSAVLTLGVMAMYLGVSL